MFQQGKLQMKKQERGSTRNYSLQETQLELVRPAKRWRAGWRVQQLQECILVHCFWPGFSRPILDIFEPKVRQKKLLAEIRCTKTG